jgi:hypothetical protein
MSGRCMPGRGPCRDEDTGFVFPSDHVAQGSQEGETEGLLELLGKTINVCI